VRLQSLVHKRLDTYFFVLLTSLWTGGVFSCLCYLKKIAVERQLHIQKPLKENSATDRPRSYYCTYLAVTCIWRELSSVNASATAV